MSDSCAAAKDTVLVAPSEEYKNTHYAESPRNVTALGISNSPGNSNGFGSFVHQHNKSNSISWAVSKTYPVFHVISHSLFGPMSYRTGVK